ncbi:MAG: DNA-directed RNA polymerase subunit omega [Akkermansia sp.]|nr:DNA-directed RNA polymerase subunit omega [Akkermansia sp.]
MKVELIEKAAQIIGDNQLLVNVVSKRVQQLNQGADPYVPTTPEMGSGDIALTEIVEGKIMWREADDDTPLISGADLKDDLFIDMSDAADIPADDDRTISATIDL